MARLSPIHTPQHIIQRGNNRQVCFAGEQDYSAYLVPTCHVGIQDGRASVPLQSRSDMRGRELKRRTSWADLAILSTNIKRRIY